MSTHRLTNRPRIFEAYRYVPDADVGAYEAAGWLNLGPIGHWSMLMAWACRCPLPDPLRAPGAPA